MRLFTTDTEREIKSADLIVSCGGGYMQSHGFKKLITDYSNHYIQLLCATKTKKKFVIFAQTIGPFDRISKLITKKIIKNAELVLVREKRSYDYVLKNFKYKTMLLTSDAAFLLGKKTVNIDIKSNVMNVGITAREWIYPGYYDTQKKNLEYINSLSEFIDLIIEKYDSTIYLMPQCIGPDPDNDLIISNMIYDKVNNKEKCIVLKEDYSPEELKYIYSKMDYFIGTRMHSNIFALSEKVPCIAISYDYKTDGIMNLFKLDQYVININNLNSKILFSKYEQLINDKEVKKKIITQLNVIKKSSLKNYEVLRKIMKEKRNN